MTPHVRLRRLELARGNGRARGSPELADGGWDPIVLADGRRVSELSGAEREDLVRQLEEELRPPSPGEWDALGCWVEEHRQALWALEAGGGLPVGLVTNMRYCLRNLRAGDRESVVWAVRVRQARALVEEVTGGEGEGD